MSACILYLIIGINKQIFKIRGRVLIVKKYSKKLVVSGKIIESYEYQNPIFYNHEYIPNPLGRGSQCVDDKDKEKNREKVLNRARRDIRRLINANVGMYSGITSKFVTFTFAQNIQDLKSANYEWKKFKQRLNDYFDKDIKYLVVIEFQERGAIHYHVVFFNMPFIRQDVLSRLWGNGHVWINKIDNVDNVGAYVCKYLTKDTMDHRLRGKKCYFCSKGLYKPIEIINQSKIDELEAHLSDKNCTYDTLFTNEYNVIRYKQYNMNKKS